MVKVSYLLGLTAGLCFLSTSVFAQELILEETEGGWIIENWEDTGVENQETDIDKIEVIEPEPVITTSATGTSIKKSKTVTRKTVSSSGSVKSGASNKVTTSTNYST